MASTRITLQYLCRQGCIQLCILQQVWSNKIAIVAAHHLTHKLALRQYLAVHVELADMGRQAVVSAVPVQHFKDGLGPFILAFPCNIRIALYADLKLNNDI